MVGRIVLLVIACSIGFGGLFVIAVGAKIDLTSGVQSQAFGLADLAVAALYIIAANSFMPPKQLLGPTLTPEERRTIEEIDNLLSHVSGVNDERDTVPILLGLRERWPIVRRAILNGRTMGVPEHIWARAACAAGALAILVGIILAWILS